MKKDNINRREFLTRTAKIGAAGMVAPALLTSCGGKKNTPLRAEGTYYVPELLDKAVDGRELKVGLVGCGGRGSGAIQNLLHAADGITVAALGDVFADRLNGAREMLADDYNQNVPDEACFIGFDAYQKVIDSGIDMVILATPPAFRPDQFKYAVEKGVHAFLEKPIAVDAKGFRTCMAAAKMAQAKGLSVITGTQRHHQRPYVEAFKLIQQGTIGQITGGNVYWNQGQLWYREREKGWSDMEWMIRDWVNWEWLSGDHIVEQHVHNIDVFMWMTGMIPVSATAFGARHRRVTGDQYDQFSVDFDFGNGVHLHSMCRQINGTSTNVSERINGTKGYWDSSDHTIRDLEGNIIWQYKEDPAFQQNDPYTLEHVDWVNHIRKGTAHEEASGTAQSSLAGVMGREAAYSGQTVEWEQISAADLDLMPEKLEIGPMDMSKYKVHVPGEA
ncbi:MAG: Gfo/Idh/MocA family oxidoreductase [Bacteroidales bacterium]|nr:Gfo/Idh/MocA family oxidoreductase [Candidatus Cryptobacteroides choladohippi]MCQ2179006.1 Gfo/Idh/MocA family oxidoreductase [Bacteroidales bacterium]